jgi:site-specific recombinase XerD
VQQQSQRIILTNEAVIIGKERPLFDDARLAIAGWLSGYGGTTRGAHMTEMRLWAQWLTNLPESTDLLKVKRFHLEAYARELEEVHLRRRSTVAHKLSVIAGFYKWCAIEGVLEKDPVAHVRRPKVEYITTRQYLDRTELSRFLQFASLGSPRDEALCLLLALNGLRISEALNADIEDMSFERAHNTLRIMGKGHKEAIIPLAAPTMRALLRYLDGRKHGAIFLGLEGARMNRHAAARIIKRVAKKADVKKNITPHSMRHSFITAALDAGIPLRDVQHAARHADPRTTAYYDHGRKSLDSHPTYIVSAFVAGG